MTSTNTTAAARRCPRCQRDNRCAVALGQEASQCWCHSARLNPQRIAAYRGLERCLCVKCGTELTGETATQHHDVATTSTSTTRKDSHGQ